MNEKKSPGDPTPDEIAEKMFECCDKNKDDKLTKEEFITTFMEDPVLFAIFCRNTDETEDK